MTGFDARREVVMSWIVACAAICTLVGGATFWQFGRGEPRPLASEAWVAATPLQGGQRSAGEGHLPLDYDRHDADSPGVGAFPADAAPGT